MNQERRQIVLVPLLVWAAFIALTLISLGYASWRGAPGRAAAGLGIAVIQVALIGGVFMQLGKASGLVRIASMAGLFFLGLMFLFTFADFLTR